MDQETTARLAMVQAVAAGVQAFAAVAVAWLTWKLIEATKAYVQTTRDQVAAAQAQLAELREARHASEAQLDELRAARAASFRPVIHPEGVGSSTGGMTAETLTIRISNLGEGPAMDLAFEDDGSAFICDPLRMTLPPHKDQTFTLTARGRKLPPTTQIAFVYRDVEQGRWRTRFSLDLHRESGSDRVIEVETTRAE